MKNAYNKVVSRLLAKKSNGNNFQSAFRFFRVSPNSTLGFPTTSTIRQQCSRGVGALYIFKLHHPHPDGFTHGIHLRLNGFVHRRLFEQLLEQFVACFCGEMLTLKAIVPLIKKTVSLFDYLATLYVIPKNLLVNFSHHTDVVAETQRNVSINIKENAALKAKMLALTQQIIDTMVAMPSKYSQSHLCMTLVMKNDQYRRYMRATNLDEIVIRVAQDAYNIALQDKRLKLAEVQELMEPMTKRSMLNRCINPRVTKQVQLLLQQTFENQFVHPHPYNGIVRSNLPKLRALDGIVFDPRFLFAILMVSRWFVRACMLEDQYTSNNNAHLLLYGGAGTGKTLLVSAISSSIDTYKYLTESRFQNPDLLKSSLLSLEEFKTLDLPASQYKQLLDLKSHMKIDFKNLNPENVTAGVPCMITTNDDVFTVLRSQKKYNQASVDAALRRLYIIPMKAGPYEKLHARVPRTSPVWQQLLGCDHRFDQEPDKLQRIFNLIVSFALYQSDIKGYYFDSRIHGYFSTLAKDFARTTFGTFYIIHKEKIDDIIREVEHSMTLSDQDDSSYLVKVSTCVGQFQQLLYEFIAQHCNGIPEIDMTIFKDKTVPWPAKAYYLLDNYKFVIRTMKQVDNHKLYLNEEIRGFIDNPHMQLYRLTDQTVRDNAEDDPYQDLKAVSQSSFSLDDPFATPPQRQNSKQSPMSPEKGFNDIEIESMMSFTSLGKRAVSQRLFAMDENTVREDAQRDDQEDEFDQQCLHNLFQ